MKNKKWHVDGAALTEEIKRIYEEHYEQAYDKTIHDFYNAVCKRIRRYTIEVKRGEWLTGYPVHCSICGGSAPTDYEDCNRYDAWLTPFCPHCGNPMKSK
jgi:hypothetical protein